MAEPEFPPRMFTLGCEPEPDKSIHYFSGKRDLMKALKDAVRVDEWEELRNSSLGVFVKWYDLNFVWCSRMVHYLLTNQLDVDQKHELWFLLGVQPARFSLHEFEQLTQLNCDYVENLEYPEVECTPEMRTMWDHLGLALEVGPSYAQLLEACSSCGDWERQERIWLGYLAIYTSFIDAQHWTTPSKSEMMKLLLSPGALDSYPWGRLAFKILVDSVKTEANRKLHEGKNYQISGFAEALNVWVYWACPGFATIYGNPLPDNPLPPLLAYKGSRNRKKVDVALRKQIRVNNFSLKEFDEMFPQWDDGEDDERVVNIVKACFGHFDRPWRWSSKHWKNDGVYSIDKEVPHGTSQMVKYEGRLTEAKVKRKGDKRKNTTAGSEAEEEEFGGDKKRAKSSGDDADGDVVYFIKKVRVELLEGMGDLLRIVNEGFADVGDKIRVLQKEVRLLSRGKSMTVSDGAAIGNGGKDKNDVNVNTGKSGAKRKSVSEKVDDIDDTLNKGVDDAVDKKSEDGGVEDKSYGGVEKSDDGEDAEDGIGDGGVGGGNKTDGGVDGGGKKDVGNDSYVEGHDVGDTTLAQIAGRSKPKKDRRKGNHPQKLRVKLAVPPANVKAGEQKRTEPVASTVEHADDKEQTQPDKPSDAKTQPVVDVGSSLVGSEASVVIVDKATTGVNFDAAYMAKQDSKKVAADAFVKAKVQELKKKEELKRDRKSPTEVQITPRYDPCAHANRTEVKEINDYVKALPGYPERREGSSVRWFHDLRTPREWLHDTHIDAGIDLMRLRQEEHPEWFWTDRLTFIDTLMCNLWRTHYQGFVDSGKGDDGVEVPPTARRMPPGIWDYHAGALPYYKKSNKTWGLEIDYIYTALHVAGNHWVAIMISIPERHITVWDSILGPKTESNVEPAVKPICEIFPYVMHYMAPIDDRWNYSVDPYTSTIVRDRDLPQNKQVGDCGVYCLKFIEFHSLGMPFPKWLCDKNMKVCRDKLAHEIITKLHRNGQQPRAAEENVLLDVYG